MNRLAVSPDSTSYGVEEGASVLSVELDGGLGRYRADILNASKRVSCTWIVGPGDFAYLQSFNRVFQRSGEQFLVSLITQTAALEDHYAYIVPGSWRLTEQQGLRYTLSATLEVIPVVSADTGLDDFVIAVRPEYGNDEEFQGVFAQLEQLTISGLPEL